jgi:L-ascorbate metabolism protein UlaG (beta-lactamase superfamily)
MPKNTPPTSHHPAPTESWGSPPRLISAVRRDESFVADLDHCSSNDPDDFQLWWLGQSGYLIQYCGERLLIDPYLSDSLTKKYAGSDHPHVRMSERVVGPNLLRGINVITSSHNHTDHLDADTLQPILANNPDAQMIIPEANREFAAGRTSRDASFPIGLWDGHSVTVGRFSFHGIPAAHNEQEYDDTGRDKFMGYVISFGRWNIYHSGDTLLYPGMVERLLPFNIDLALLPINGNDPARGVAGNLSIEEAITLSQQISARWLLPMHYDLFTFNTVDVNRFAAAASSAGVRYCVLDHGGRMNGKELANVTIGKFTSIASP